MEPFLLVRRDSYHDSVVLMRISRELASREDVTDAVVVMGTPHNRRLLAESGYEEAELATAGPNDLVIAVRARSLSSREIEEAVDELLAAPAHATAAEQRPRTLATALAANPGAKLVLISVPGEHAAREARRVIGAGRHVMIFSDNVPLDEEVVLKTEAIARGLLVMGPDCGTAIINGLPLGFANAVRRGKIGIVGASGTGIQEVTCCVDSLGGGISQAIGTGGRDLSEAVNGAMTVAGIQALAADPSTEVLVVISKPPAPRVAARVLSALAATPKPSVAHFVGAEARADDENAGVVFTDTLAATAAKACRLAGIPPALRQQQEPENERIEALSAHLTPAAKLLGLYCGGTLGQEALTLLTRAGFEIRSNLQHCEELRCDGTSPVANHMLLDLGDDAFTRGRPHPMLEPGLRNERLEVEMKRADVQLLLCDVVLGYGSHSDPAGVLAAGIARAREIASGRELVAITSITGTPADPQDLAIQRERLEAAGAVVADDNQSAVELAAAVLARAG